MTQWHQQTTKLLYEDILWSRPENKYGAGKLLIIGGNKYGFAAPADAYTQSLRAGVGAVRILMPIGVQPFIGHTQDVYLSADNPSGSFSQKALADMLQHTSWADAVLLAGDFGRNSETAITLEKLASGTTGPLVVTKDAVDLFVVHTNALLNRDNTCLVISSAQLQKIAINAQWTEPVTFDMNLSRIAAWLASFTNKFPVIIVTSHQQQLIVAYGGEVVSQLTGSENKVWRVPVAAYTAVYWLQNPQKPLQTIATALYAYCHPDKTSY